MIFNCINNDEFKPLEPRGHLRNMRICERYIFSRSPRVSVEHINLCTERSVRHKRHSVQQRGSVRYMEDKAPAHSIEYPTKWSCRIGSGSWLCGPAVVYDNEIAGNSTTSNTILPAQDNFRNLHFGGVGDFIPRFNMHRGGALLSVVLTP
ncbi:hypothetical protein OS493_009095 [Desmophyllum pertusum]|uniref:Uncharacterized protein n=1 Tax=Desmophyllum pertusum TaxID=174260 RepID=A0A9X0D0S9_9CNID|nr:hypothetical protein OS493_009095 [Desmophyllum pertusum]